MLELTLLSSAEIRSHSESRSNPPQSSGPGRYNVLTISSGSTGTPAPIFGGFLSSSMGSKSHGLKRPNSGLLSHLK